MRGKFGNFKSDYLPPETVLTICLTDIFTCCWYSEGIRNARRWGQSLHWWTTFCVHCVDSARRTCREGRFTTGRQGSKALSDNNFYHNFCSGFRVVWVSPYRSKFRRSLGGDGSFGGHCRTTCRARKWFVSRWMKKNEAIDIFLGIFRRMCDLLDDPGPVTAPSSRKNSNAEALGLVLGKFPPGMIN